jgi:hypothetical protein
MRKFLGYGLVVLLSAGLLGGCAGKSKFQNKMKGLWVLKSRTLPDGVKVEPPGISGRLEWFPMDVDAETAHVSILTTHGNTDLRIQGLHYDIEGQNRFTVTSYLEVGGGISKNPGKAYQSTKSSDSGSISEEGSTITFKHNKGYTFAFTASNLTIQHQDGTVDILEK